MASPEDKYKAESDQIAKISRERGDEIWRMDDKAKIALVNNLFRELAQHQAVFETLELTDERGAESAIFAAGKDTLNELARQLRWKTRPGVRFLI